MGWGSANDIVDPVIEQLDRSIEHEEMSPSAATRLLVTLIKKCQEGDWDTEDETLEQFAHLPWVVKAFKECDVQLPCYDADGVRRIVLSIIKERVSPDFHDLSDDHVREVLADAVAQAVEPHLKTS